MAKMSGADIVLESLKRLDATTIFGYPGGVVLPLYDRLPAHPEIRHILVRHEQGGGHAADGYARASGQLGVALATSGPGATNLVTAVTNAMMDSVPVLFITGNVGRNLLGKDGFQEADITGITMPIVKHNYLVMRAQDLAYTFAEAAHIAMTGRPGPVHIDIPKDVFIEEADFEWPTELTIRGYRPVTRGNPAQVKRAAAIIDAAERPIIFAGHGIILGNADQELRAFAEKGGIPVIHTLLGLGGMPHDHVLNYGMMGMHGSFWANHAASNADVIVGLGMRMDDRALGRFADMNPTAKVVHVDIDPAEHNKNIIASVPIVGDVRQVLPQLTEAIEQRSHIEWLRWIDQMREDHKQSFSVPNGGQLTTQYVVERIADSIGAEGIVTTGVGQHQMWAAQFMRITRPRQLVTSGGPRHDGLRGAGGDGGAGGVPRPPGVEHLRRRRVPDDVPGDRHDGGRASAGEDGDHEQRLSRHGPPVAGADLPGQLRRGGHVAARLREAGGGLRHQGHADHREGAGRGRDRRGERLRRPGHPRLPRRGRGQRLADGARRRVSERDGGDQGRDRAPARPRADGEGAGPMKHTVVALVEDRPGVLNRVASLFRRRGFNIESLAVGTTEEDGISRMTIVLDGDDGIVEQVEKQLYKLIDVVKVSDLTKEEAVTRELALIKVHCTREQRGDVLDVIQIFRAQAVDVTPNSLMVQIVAAAETLDALVDNLRPYGVKEMVRTGRIAMMRGSRTTAVHEREPEPVHRFHLEAGRRPEEEELPFVSK
jgi:acetolactate synthase-1/2/3 large subunit